MSQKTLFLPGFQPISDDGIDTLKFLEACEKIPGIFDILGGAVFAPVKKDVIGNIIKIKNRYLQKPDKFETLAGIIDEENIETDKKLKEDGNGIATNALKWLKRGLKFILLFIEHLINNDYCKENPENLKPCAQIAYQGSLKQHHNWIITKVVEAACHACPYRNDFLNKLAEHEGLEIKDDDAAEKKYNELFKMMEEFTKNFRLTVDQIYKMYEEKGIEKGIYQQQIGQ